MWYIWLVLVLFHYYLPMKLTEKAIKCQELGADNTLSFWCIVYTKKDASERWGFWFYNKSDHEYYWSIDLNIWHPLNRWRLCYLESKRSSVFNTFEYVAINVFFSKHPELYNQTILDRQHNDELMELILAFLLSLQDK